MGMLGFVENVGGSAGIHSVVHVFRQISRVVAVFGVFGRQYQERRVDVFGFGNEIPSTILAQKVFERRKRFRYSEFVKFQKEAFAEGGVRKDRFLRFFKNLLRNLLIEHVVFFRTEIDAPNAIFARNEPFRKEALGRIFEEP